MEQCCRRPPGSLLFLLLLALLSRAGSSFNPSINWKSLHSAFLNSEYSQKSDVELWNKVDEQVLQYCDGVFDLYYIMDASQTMSDWTMLWSCWEDMVEKYVNGNTRMSFIMYSSTATVKMKLTSDRFRIFDELRRVQRTRVKGEMYLQEGIKQANSQIARNNFGVKKVASLIITVVSRPLDPNSLKQTLMEAARARTMGSYVYCIGVDRADEDQVKAIADSPENAFYVKGSALDLHPVVDEIGTKACLELRVLKPSPLCLENKQILLKGYGFHNAKSLNDIICRFRSGTMMVDKRALWRNMTTIICPQPEQLKAGLNVELELSLNSRRDFLVHSIKVPVVQDCPFLPESYVTSTTLPKTTTPVTRQRPRTTTSTKRTSPPRATKPATEPTTELAPVPVPVPVPESVPLPALLVSDETLLLLTEVLGLLLIPVLLWWCWWLCCRKVEEEPPPPPPKPKKKQKVKKPGGQPPPPPPPPPPSVSPVTVCPIVIVCCCACRGVCVNRGLEGTVTMCNFSHPRCHQVPLIWSQPSDKGSCTNFDFLKMLCAEGSWDPRIGLQSSQDNLPLAYCSQCHHHTARSGRPPSRMLPLLPDSAHMACRPTLSLPAP